MITCKDVDCIKGQLCTLFRKKYDKCKISERSQSIIGHVKSSLLRQQVFHECQVPLRNYKIVSEFSNSTFYSIKLK